MLESPKKRMSILALDELKRRDDLESLRKYLISENCFPAQKDPESSPIAMEDLKKLARIWKLNERRNFWKTHSERDELVTALIQHAEQAKGFASKKAAIANDVTVNKPIPPTDPRSSNPNARRDVIIKNFYGLKYFNREVNSEELQISSRFYTFPATESAMENVVDRWRTEDFSMKDELLNPTNITTNATNPGVRNSVLPTNSSINSNGNGSTASRHAQGMKNKVKLMKQRNLAIHLMNYSAHIDFKKTTFSVKTVQTFINVAEIDDAKTVSHCMIALSNISVDPQVRSILFETNTIHKITNFIQFLRGKSAHWAAGLLFYYFSCDKESEDRVYNASAALLQSNGMSKDHDFRMLALNTLNNLMPCIDRQRVADIIMRIFFTHFDVNTIFHDKQMCSLYLSIMLNMSWFSNVHSTLLNANILELLDQFASHAAMYKNADIAGNVAKILLSFLQLPEQAANLITIDFINVLCKLYTIEQETALLQALRVAVILSTIPTLRSLVRTSKLISTICMMIQSKSLITNSIAKETSKFLVNMTLLTTESTLMRSVAIANSATTATTTNTTDNTNTNNNTNNNNNIPNLPSVPYMMLSPIEQKNLLQQQRILEMELLLKDNVPDAIFATLKSNNATIPVKSLTIKVLQNIVSYPTNAFILVNICLEPVTKFLKDYNDINAAYILYNLSVIPQCRSDLVDNKIHVKVLELMCMTKDILLKSICLQILVQLSSSNICVMELLKLDLISKLEGQLKLQNTTTSTTNSTTASGKKSTTTDNTSTSSSSSNIWKDISLMLVAVVAYAAGDLTYRDKLSVVNILRTICIHGTDEEILENCANVLKFISAQFEDFNVLDPVIRAIIELADSEEVVDCLSTILYNLTCNKENLSLMLSNIYYLNVMIRFMRNGKMEVQENIAQAMASLCSIDKCTLLLLRNDVLSDLIVIALLRTSSEEIKVVCSQAFYNMLCHDNTRLELLKDDLWWALMRLGRTDSNLVHKICIRALADLAAYNEDNHHDDNQGGGSHRGIIMQRQRIEALRKHHIITFIKDLCIAMPSEDLISCVEVTHNLLRQFTPHTSTNSFLDNTSSGMKNGKHKVSLAVSLGITDNNNNIIVNTNTNNTNVDSTGLNCTANEIVAAVRIGVDAFARGPNLKCVRIATILLLKCAEHPYDAVASEFLNLDIVEIVKQQRSGWSQHPDCRLNISRLFFELSKNRVFTKAIALSELNPILSACYEHEHSLEICENIAYIILQFAYAENVPAKQFMSLNIWEIALKEGLSSDSKVLIKNNLSHLMALASKQRMTMVGGASGGSSNRNSVMNSSGTAAAAAGLAPRPRQSMAMYTRDVAVLGVGSNSNLNTNSNSNPSMMNATNNATTGAAMVNDISDALKGKQPNAFRIQGMVLTTLAYAIEQMLSDSNNKRVDSGNKTNNNNNNNNNNSQKTVANPAQLLTGGLISGLVRTELMDHPWTRANLLAVIHSISQSNATVVAPLLTTDTFSLLSRYLLSSVGSSRHSKALEFSSAFLRNISLHDSVISRLIAIPQGALNEFIHEICENISSEVAMDMSVFFYHTANYLMQMDGHLNPKFVIEMITKISASEKLVKEDEVHNINKYTMSTILNKYTFGSGVDPILIQNMFAYMQSPASALIPELMREISFKTLADFKYNLTVANDFLSTKDSVGIELLAFPCNADQWTPVVHHTFKKNETIILKIHESQPSIHEKLEPADSAPLTIYSKITKHYDPVKESIGGGEHHAIEETEHDDMDDEDDEEHGDDRSQHTHHSLSTTATNNNNNDKENNNNTEIEVLTSDNLSTLNQSMSGSNKFSQTSLKNLVITEEHDREDKEDTITEASEEDKHSAKHSSPRNANDDGDVNNNTAFATIVEVDNDNNNAAAIAEHETTSNKSIASSVKVQDDTVAATTRTATPPLKTSSHDSNKQETNTTTALAVASAFVGIALENGSVGGNSAKLSVGSSSIKARPPSNGSRSNTPRGGSVRRPMSSSSNHDKDEDEHEYSASFEEISSNNVSVPK